VKVKEKLNNAVFLDQKAYDRIFKEAPRIQMLTVNSLIEKFKVNGSVARACLKELYAKALIKPVGDQHASFKLFTGTQWKAVDLEADAKKAKKDKKDNDEAKLVAKEAIKEAKAAAK
jgi:small subunit ribosomal protein S25e